MVQLGKELRKLEKRLLASRETTPAASPNALLDSPITMRSAVMMYAGERFIKTVFNFVKGAPFEIGYAKLSEVALALPWPTSGTIVTPNDLPIVFHLPPTYHMVKPEDAGFLAMEVVLAVAAVLFVKSTLLNTLLNFSTNTEADAKDDELPKDQELPEVEQQDKIFVRDIHIDKIFMQDISVAEAVPGMLDGSNAPPDNKNSGIEDKPGMPSKKNAPSTKKE